MNISECIFNGCANPRVSNTTKCAFHKNRDKCRMTECHNQVYARGLCVRHGGKKQCAFEGCVGNARSGSFCCRHGQPSKKKLCDHHGCTRVAHANHKCVAHGGGRKCKVASCASHARQGGLCQRHRVDQTDSDTSSDVGSDTTASSWDSMTWPLDEETAWLFNQTTNFKVEELDIAETNDASYWCDLDNAVLEFILEAPLMTLNATTVM
ncbi:Aste57867_4989 [Aphanomyces stellatus]|uniref:Aste57867_4989 protein n=2 Tax=Aphanomyces stellatus TaxID=120398 RepID=A0A485KG75_9STRA|nr:hypothetical protein As57867_004976 [Aphanomyces stellatus]VFT82075.1 Aste57867_4989 [Aphanomyces stellatus]